VTFSEVCRRGIGKRAGEVLGRSENPGRAGGAIAGEAGSWAGRRVEDWQVVISAVPKWPEPAGERRGCTKDGLVLVFLSTLVGTVGSLEKPCE